MELVYNFVKTMDATILYNIGQTVKRMRSLRGWSQLDLALEAGIDRRYMSDIENGKRNLSIDVLLRLSAALGVEASVIMRSAEQAAQPSLMPFVSVEELKSWLVGRGYEDTVVLENPDYLPAVIGISESGRLIYSYDYMVEHLCTTDGMSIEEAEEYIDYNTIRSLPYAGEYAPIIIYKIED